MSVARNNEWGSNMQKRYQIRQLIRRKMIDQHHSKIRNKILQQIRSAKYLPSFQSQENITQNQRQDEFFHNQNFDEFLSQKQEQLKSMIGNYQQKDNDCTKYNLQTKQILQQLSLSNSQILCKKQTLNLLLKMISINQFNQIESKMGHILMKITLSQIDWDVVFINGLLVFLGQLNINNIPILQYVQNLSECCIIENKITIYKLVLSFCILESSEEPNYSSFLLKILSNFMMRPPRISHRHPLFQQINSQINYMFTLSKLQYLIKNCATNIKINATKQTMHKKQQQMLLMFEIFKNLLGDLQQEQYKILVVKMYQKNWETICLITQTYEEILRTNSKTKTQKKQLSHVIQEHPMLIRMRLEYLKIFLNILSAYQCGPELQRAILGFLYAFLPKLFSILAEDLCQFQLIRKNRQEKNNTNNILKQYGKGNKSQLKKKYQDIFNQLIQTLLSIHNQLGELPALQFIQTADSSFLLRYYSIYQNKQLKNQSQNRYLISITQALLQYDPKACQKVYLVQYLKNLIIQFDTSSNKIKQLLKVLKKATNFLQSHVDCQNKQQKRCSMILRLNQNYIINKLQNLLGLVINFDFQGADYIQILLEFLANHTQ